MASYLIKGKEPAVRRRLTTSPKCHVLISVVTEAELLYGLAQKAYPSALTHLVRQFLLQVDILPWDSKTAQAYADLRASCAKLGVTLGSLDMMIAAHAIAAHATLVTHDLAFFRIPKEVLAIEDWLLP